MICSMNLIVFLLAISRVSVFVSVIFIANKNNLLVEQRKFILAKHLIEAIWINFVRSFFYAYHSRGYSLPLSWFLIFAELVSIPTSILMDVWFLIVTGRSLDEIFVPMHNIKSVSTPPLYTRKMPRELYQEFHRRFYQYFGQSWRRMRNAQFVEMVHETKALLEQVHAAEASVQCHMEMSRHLLESVGLTLFRASVEKREKGRGRLFFSFLIAAHLICIVPCIYIDAWATKIHHRGLGILVNDVPPIPFLAELKQSDT